MIKAYKKHLRTPYLAVLLFWSIVQRAQTYDILADMLLRTGIIRYITLIRCHWWRHDEVPKKSY